jgi:hypothetical protein
MVSAPSAEDERSQGDELDDLTKALAQTSLSESKPSNESKPKTTLKKPETIINVPDSELRHVIHGELVPQADVLELQTVKSIYEVTWLVCFQIASTSGSELISA